MTRQVKIKYIIVMYVIRKVEEAVGGGDRERRGRGGGWCRGEEGDWGLLSLG